MKTLQEKKDKYAIEQGYEDWTELVIINELNADKLDRHWTEICIRAQKAALEKAAENVVMTHKSNLQESKVTSLETHYSAKNIAKTTIDKHSITNEQNLIL